MSGVWDYPSPPEPREIPERDEDELYQERKDDELLRQWERSQESAPKT